MSDAVDLAIGSSRGEREQERANIPSAASGCPSEPAGRAVSGVGGAAHDGGCLEPVNALTVPAPPITYARGRPLQDNRPSPRYAATIAEFIQQLDADRAPNKSGAAYICGPLTNGCKRSAGAALPRTWLAIDLDRIDLAAYPAVLQWAAGFDGCGWETHSSSPEAPRARIIFRLERPASRADCIAIGEQIVQEVRRLFQDRVEVDPCTFRPEQPVFVPPTGAEILRFTGSPFDFRPTCTEEDRRELKPSSVSSVSSVHGRVTVGGTQWLIPPATIPTEEGQRNACLFRLARHVKAMQPEPTPEELRRILRAWHGLAEPAIRTKDFAASVGEFMHAYGQVKQPHGATMEPIIASIDNEAPLPRGIEKLGYGEAGNHLVRICAALQAHEGSGPFFLGARQAGTLIGEPFVDASRMMKALVHDGVLELVSKGAGMKASRYRFVWPSDGLVGADLQSQSCAHSGGASAAGPDP